MPRVVLLVVPVRVIQNISGSPNTIVIVPSRDTLIAQVVMSLIIYPALICHSTSNIILSAKSGLPMI